MSLDRIIGFATFVPLIDPAIQVGVGTIYPTEVDGITMMKSHSEVIHIDVRVNGFGYHPIEFREASGERVIHQVFQRIALA